MLTPPAWYAFRAATVLVAVAAIFLSAWFVSTFRPGWLFDAALSALMIGLLAGLFLPAPWTYTQYQRRVAGAATKRRRA
jgi:hypothetical protein